MGPLPPPYSPNRNYNTIHNNDRTPLNGTCTIVSRPRSSWSARVRGVLIWLLVLLVVAQNSGYMSTMADGTPASTKAKLRRQWQRETTKHEREVVRWEHSRAEYRQEVERRQHDREVWRKEVEVEREEWWTTQKAMRQEWWAAQTAERARWLREREAEHAEDEWKRDEWQRKMAEERAADERTRQAERDEWQRKMAGERAAEEHNRQKLRGEFEAERGEWARQRQEEERHRKEIEHRRQGVRWGDKWGGTCTEFGIRAYHADLWDIPGDLNWLEVCMDMPIQLNGKPFDSPDKCERNNKGHVTATWFIEDDPECTTYWDKLYDKGCSAGQSGMRRYEARLMNLKRGEDWDRMCRTTPANIYGLRYDHPTVCEDRNGRTGIWDHPDDWCN